jgi:hypothetical protein
LKHCMPFVNSPLLSTLNPLHGCWLAAQPASGNAVLERQASDTPIIVHDRNNLLARVTSICSMECARQQTTNMRSAECCHD